MSKGALGLLSAYWPERTARHAHIPLERITTFALHKPAAAHGERPALVTPERSVTFAELSALVGKVSAAVTGRAPEGGRVAVIAPDPIDLAAVALGCLEADRLTFLSAEPVAPGLLEAFSADLVVGDAPGALAPSELMAAEAATPAKPNLRLPVLALARPWGGEVLHNHKTLVSTAISFGSFFMLEPGAEVVCFEPPTTWLGLAAALGCWHKGTTLRAAWGPGWTGHPDRVDYLVASWADAEARYLGSAPHLRDVHAGVGAILGVEGTFNTGRRRRLARRLRTPVLTLLGRNDLGPVVGSHPTWYLDDSAGIPMPNVELKPLNPSDGSELTIGWDAVEEGEIGVKSTMSPAGGVLTNTWLRSFLTAVIDPTGVYFLRRELGFPAPEAPPAPDAPEAP